MKYESITKPSQVKPGDIIIAIMGPTGSGKSRIIDTLTGQTGKRAGSTLESCTSNVSGVRIKGHAIYEDSLVLVDTPGFDDTNRSDMEILQTISKWLVDMYKKDVLLHGILYLHRITDNRMSGKPHRNLRMFGELCGTKAAKGVVLVTTMWDKLKVKEIGEARERELQATFWNAMLHNGASIARFNNQYECARDIIDDVVGKHIEGVGLLLQEEMVDYNRRLNETHAGQALYTTLQTLLAQQKETLRLLAEQAKEENSREEASQLAIQYRKNREDVEKTFQDVNKLRISFGRRLGLLFFGKRVQTPSLNLG